LVQDSVTDYDTVDVPAETSNTRGTMTGEIELRARARRRYVTARTTVRIGL
jgi:hypothetical protein